MLSRRDSCDYPRHIIRWNCLSTGMNSLYQSDLCCLGSVQHHNSILDRIPSRHD
jgi:hypothetical protein